VSDKLVVEFYSQDSPAEPLASILATFGGDNPSSAATTLCDFFDRISTLREPRFDDASVLAARFIVWESSKSGGGGQLEFTHVSLLRGGGPSPYQTVRVYEREGRPYVHCVIDKYTTANELQEAAFILRQDSVGPPAPV
jgi:hypothetical protein